MRVLTQGVDLTRTLRKLMRRYKRYRWAVAWASVECPLYVQLRKHPERISQMVVGTHFYQTHPGFLEAFARHRKVRFVLHTDGVFHPKVYLFENDADNWACIVGSPNFTGAAFSKNVETAVLFDSTGEESRRIYSRLSTILDKHWKRGNRLTKDQRKRYRLLWERARERLRKLGGRFGRRR